MVAERWQKILDAQGDAIALRQPGRTWTFAELDRAARARPAETCPVLGRFHLARGDAASLATALLAGFLDSHPVQVVEADRERRLPAAPPPPGTALIKQTVGSSGRRRCQFFSLPQVLADTDRLHAALGLAELDGVVAAISVAHSYGLSTTLLQLLAHGLPVHWLPSPFPAGLSEALALPGRRLLPGVPALWKAWLDAGIDFHSIGRAVSAGAPLRLDLEQRLHACAGLKLHNLYGTSETGAVSGDLTDQPRTDASDLGSLLPGVSAQPGPDGRLCVASDAVGLGYDAPEPGEVFGDGQHLAWDRIAMENDRLRFRGCLGTGIQVAGRKLSPHEVAARLRAAAGRPGIEVRGEPSRDPERGQDIVAVVDLPPDQLTREFKTRACASLAPWETPRRWVSSSA
jgi:long-chain acyl-CoA synthetase